ncbi:MAG: LacI family transcriptional regulator [Treponema sp.]|nr:LacI family transcriptional regulator [Treponema sp.]
MTQNTATIYDVANEAQVSPATVSRVLNEPSKVNAEKRDKVLAAIASLHFVPKAAAVANARQSYKKIGVIAPFFTQPSFMQRLRGISNVLSGHHYEIVVYSIESQEEMLEYIDMLTGSRRVDGLIVLCLKLTDMMLSKLRESGISVCFVESNMEGFDSVVIDNESGGKLAAEFLFNKGYRRPGFVGESSNKTYAVPATEERLRGFTGFFAKHGISIMTEHTWLGEFTDQKVDEGISRLLSQKVLPDCILASSDLIAIRVMKLAKINGIQIPEDIALVGFDNLDFTEYLNLTTVSQELDESGRTAAELILDRQKDPDRTARKVHIQLRIVERATTGTKTGSKNITGGLI